MSNRAKIKPEALFKTEFKLSAWPDIPLILRQAHAAAREFYKENPPLQIPSGLQNFGTYYAIAADFGLERAIGSGRLPWDYCWRPFARPTGKYLEMRLGSLTMSQNVVHNSRKPPRNVRFRENKRLGYQTELFPETQNDGTMPHFLLIHGYKKAGHGIDEPEFAHFGYPFSSSRWEWKSDNLMKMPYLVSESADTEDTESDFEEIQLLKEDIERWKRDND